MKIVGIIAEYNPFHNGHQYHIDQALQKTGADAAVILMSGDFVQRGAPAIAPKHLRAKAALLGGASLILELPVLFPVAVQSCLQEVPFLFLTVLAVFPISALAVSVAISKTQSACPDSFRRARSLPAAPAG